MILRRADRLEGIGRRLSHPDVAILEGRDECGDGDLGGPAALATTPPASAPAIAAD